jgi:hypothetical protein
VAFNATRLATRLPVSVTGFHLPLALQLVSQSVWAAFTCHSPCNSSPSQSGRPLLATRLATRLPVSLDGIHVPLALQLVFQPVWSAFTCHSSSSESGRPSRVTRLATRFKSACAPNCTPTDIYECLGFQTRAYEMAGGYKDTEIANFSKKHRFASQIREGG